MNKNDLIEHATATPDDAKAAILVTVLPDGKLEVFVSGVGAAGVVQMLGAAIVETGKRMAVPAP